VKHFGRAKFIPKSFIFVSAISLGSDELKAGRWASMPIRKLFEVISIAFNEEMVKTCYLGNLCYLVIYFLKIVLVVEVFLHDCFSILDPGRHHFQGDRFEQLVFMLVGNVHEHVSSFRALFFLSDEAIQVHVVFGILVSATEIVVKHLD
jgi:hypothetical protein